MWLGFHVADSELSIQQPIPWVTRSQGRERTCECNPGRRLHPHKYPEFPVCLQGTKGRGNKQLLMMQGLHSRWWMGRQSDFSAGRNKEKRDCDRGRCDIGWICKREAKRWEQEAESLRRKCRGTVVFDVTGNSWWKETKMWLDYMISSSKCRYLIFLTSPLTLIHSLSIAVMNAWLWRKAESSPGWRPLSDLVFVLTCCTHLRLLLCGQSLTLPLSFSLSLNCMLSNTHTSLFWLFLILPHPPSPSV